MRTFETPLGTFSDSTDYRKALREAGYTDMGWQNGWDEHAYTDWDEAKAKHPDQLIESLSWNNRGTDEMYVLHDSKVFCSVDMGD